MTREELAKEVRQMLERMKAGRLACPDAEMAPVFLEVIRIQDGEQKRAVFAMPDIGPPGSEQKAVMKNFLKLLARDPNVLAYFMSMEMWFLSDVRREDMPPPTVSLADIEGRREGLIVIGQLADGTSEHLMVEIKRDADNAVCGFGDPEQFGQLRGDLVLIDMIQ